MLCSSTSKIVSKVILNLNLGPLYPLNYSSVIQLILASHQLFCLLCIYARWINQISDKLLYSQRTRHLAQHASITILSWGFSNIIIWRFNKFSPNTRNSIWCYYYHLFKSFEAANSTFKKILNIAKNYFTSPKPKTHPWLKLPVNQYPFFHTLVALTHHQVCYSATLLHISYFIGPKSQDKRLWPTSRMKSLPQ